MPSLRLTISVCFLLAFQVRAATWYASPTGDSGNDGSSGSPWDLRKALTNTSQVSIGDTIWLYGGLYPQLNYTSKLHGVTVRALTTNRARIECGALADGTHALRLNSTNCIYWGIDFSNTNAGWINGGGKPIAAVAEAGDDNTYRSNRLVNLIMHDGGASDYGGGQAIDAWVPSLEIYGCIISSTRYGYSMYVHNKNSAAPRWKYIRDNIAINNRGSNEGRGYQFQISSAGASTYLDNIYFDGNFSLNTAMSHSLMEMACSSDLEHALNGTFNHNVFYSNHFVQFGPYTHNFVVSNNWMIHNTSSAWDWYGCGEQIDNVEVINNFYTGTIGACAYVTFTGNTDLDPIDDWQVVVRTNMWQDGNDPRIANIAIINYTNGPSATISVVGILKTNDIWEVRDAEHYWYEDDPTPGNRVPVAKGTNTVGTITVPILGTSAPFHEPVWIDNYEGAEAETTPYVPSHSNSNINFYVLLRTGTNVATTDAVQRFDPMMFRRR